MTARSHSRTFSSRLHQLAIVSIATALTTQVSLAQTGYPDSESFRSDLLAVLELQKSLQQKYPERTKASDMSLALMEKAIIEAKAMSPEELQAFQSINFTFRPAIETMQALDKALQAAEDQNKSPSPVHASAATFDCDGYIERPGELVKPPGPCNQSNYQPAPPLSGPAPIPVQLTDNEYPTFLSCQQYQPYGLIAFSRAATIANEIIADVARRFCDQIYTVGGVGTNTALACIATDVLYLIQKGIRDTIANCQSARILSEGTANYVREGELFVQSRQNTATISRRAQDGFTESSNGLDEIRNQVEENGEKIEQTIATLGEVMEALRIENARLLNTGDERHAN